MDDISSQDLQSVRGYDRLQTHAPLRPRHLALLHAYILASTKRRLYYRGHKIPPPENAQRRIRDCRKAEPARTRGAKPRNRPCLTISRRSVGLRQGMRLSTSTSASGSPRTICPSIDSQPQKKLALPVDHSQNPPTVTRSSNPIAVYTKPTHHLPTNSKQPPQTSPSSPLHHNLPLRLAIQEPRLHSIPPHPAPLHLGNTPS